MMKLLTTFYDFDCRLFQGLNRHFDKRFLNLFFRGITHVGGATFTIVIVLVLMIFSTTQIQTVAIASALALAMSHLPVYFIKKLYPRKRPYLVFENSKSLANPLQDHSFPSGHTTAIFSVIIPFVLLNPSLSVILVPIALCVGISRIYLGLHYPTDVLAGSVLGFSCGLLFFTLLMS